MKDRVSHYRSGPTRRQPRMRRGAIFITALGIVVILSGLVLVFAQAMRTEAIASANRLSYLQADAIEQGAERWVLAQVESNPADAATITTVPADALPVGNGYFWALRADPTQTQNYTFGIADESAKVNLNKTPAARLLLLPAMTTEAADCIVDWVDADSTPGSNGAESDYYGSLPEPYQCKNAPLETVEELLLVKNITPDLLFGYDHNRNGVLEAREQTAGGMGAMFNSAGDDGRGFFNYVTVYSVEPNTSIDGTARVNVNNADRGALRKVLQKALTADRATKVLAAVTAFAGRNPLPFPTLGIFYNASTMTRAEFGKVNDHLTSSPAKTLSGLVNVNTAPKQVLMCLPGLTDSDADALVGKQSGAAAGDYSWVFDALSKSKAVGISGAITGRSFQYSADIVAVSGDGRSYKRVRIVVDSTQKPAKIVYRRDLTSLGWPLDPQVRAALRAGEGIAAGSSGFLSNASPK